MKRKKKILIYLLAVLILVFALCYFIIENYNEKAYLSKGFYDTSQQGHSEAKGQFIPEQHTNYIFTTVESEFNFRYIIILLIVILILIGIKLVRKKLNRYN